MGMMTLNLVVKIFVTNNKNQVLLLQRSKNDDLYPLDWDFPGGSIEPKEDPNDAIKRELKEEADIEVSNFHILYVATEQEPKYTVTLIFKGSAIDDSVKLSHEHVSFRWVEITKLDEFDLPIKYITASKIFSI